MEKIIRCQFNGKDGFKSSEKGMCFTYNKNQKSKLKAYQKAVNQLVEQEYLKNS
jgi:ribosomal protein S3AE